ncbi:MAG: lipopolysaccharide assembly protein LapB [Lautropia sp.]|nr:lipopolysaccharide assembly protein LapB [Lautropia sp.]
MEFEYWWLLAIPLAFLLGWVASRREGRLNAQPAALGGAYYRGVNLLLNEQYDKAIDAFVDVVRVEPEASDLHFALGALFRRRGETDRAIRVHQNLVDRADLDARSRAHALYELGLDFLKAGLVDRAEDSFNRLQGTDYAGAASRQRLEIAQRTHDWARVVDLARTTPPEPGFDPALITAHAFCELALASLRARQFDQALEKVHLAREQAPNHPRPLIIEGEIRLAQGEPAQAIEQWSVLADRHPEQVERIVGPWLQAAEDVGGHDGLRLAIARMQRLDVSHSPELLRAMSDAIARLDGKPAAAQWVRQAVTEHPTLSGLQILLALSRSDRRGSGPATVEDLDEDALQATLGRLTERMSRYACRVCGFRGQHYYWQCPGCSRWDSYASRRDEGGGY